MKKALIIFVIFYMCLQVHAQNRRIVDSLKIAYKSAKSDTAKLDILIAISAEYIYSNPDTVEIILNNATQQLNELQTKNSSKESQILKHIEANLLLQKGRLFNVKGDYDNAIEFTEKSLTIYKFLQNKKGIGNAFNILGIINDYLGNYAQAVEFYRKALELREETGDKIGVSYSLNNIGIIYYYQGNYHEALNYSLKALKIGEEINDKMSVAVSLTNIGNVFSSEGNLDKALDYYFKGLKIKEEIGDKKGIATSLSNIGVIYSKQANYTQAQKYFMQALEIREEIGDKSKVASSLNDIGIIYSNKANYKEALNYHLKALKISEEVGDKNEIAFSLNCIGDNLFELNDFKNAYNYYSKALPIIFKVGDIELLKDVHKSLSRLYEKQGNYKFAFQHQNEYYKYKDSVESEENKKALLQYQYESEYEQKELHLKAEQEKKDVIAKAEIQKQKQQRNGYIGGGVLLLLLLGVSANRYRIKNRSNAALKAAYNQLKQTQSQLIQAEKMSSLGVLTAGVAHEINNPINFVTGGISSLKENYNDVKQSYNEILQLVNSHADEVLKNKVQQLVLQSQIEEIMPEMEQLFNSVNNGSQRIAEIVKGLRTFSRLDENEKKLVILEEGIDSTLTILNSQLTNRIEVVKEYRNSSEVLCFPGQINQVFMNLLSNAADAIESEGKIFIRTYRKDAEVFIEIEDTGKGMPEEVRNRIFEPFFTTKEVGKGTGLGLSIAYSIIEKHNGKIEVESEVGKGTKFKIKLPVE